MIRLLQGRNQGLILLYHRIAAPGPDPFRMSVHPDRFREQMNVLRERCQLVALEELASDSPNATRNRPRVAVTFDDGYVDNLLAAQPILEELQVPATVFVSTGNLGRPFWWDELEWILLGRDALPEQLSLRIGGTRHEWTLRDLTFRRRRWLRLKVAIPGPQAAAHGLLRRLQGLLRLASAPERTDAMSKLAAWAGTTTVGAARACDESELRQLGSSPYIALGAHTVTHPVLASLTPTAQEEEIARSKATIEEITGNRVRTLSYPFGQLGDYSRETMGIARRLGFSLACSARSAVVRERSPRFALPRLWVEDWGSARFKTWLERWS